MNDTKLAQELHEAEVKAIKALAGYKFAMFGYWAGIWVHLNRIEGKKRPSPFKFLVQAARELPVEMGGRDAPARDTGIRIERIDGSVTEILVEAHGTGIRAEPAGGAL